LQSHSEKSISSQIDDSLISEARMHQMIRIHTLSHSYNRSPIFA